MALDGFTWQGQCMTGEQLAQQMVGYVIGPNQVATACNQPTGGSMTCFYPTDSSQYNVWTIALSGCDSSLVNAGDLGVTVEITGAVLLLALGVIAGLLS